MRYHYQKPDIYLSMYGELYICNHPVYDRCTLFTIGNKVHIGPRLIRG